MFIKHEERREAAAAGHFDTRQPSWKRMKKVAKNEKE